MKRGFGDRQKKLGRRLVTKVNVEIRRFTQSPKVSTGQLCFLPTTPSLHVYRIKRRVYPCVSVMVLESFPLFKRDYSPPENNNCCEDHLHAQHGHKFRARANRGSCCETELVHAPLLDEQSTFINLFPPFIFVARMPPFRKRQMACANHTECFFNLDFHRAQQNWSAATTINSH